MRNIEKFNVIELDNQSLTEINGGGIWGKIWDATLGYVIGEVIDGVGRGLAQPCTKKCAC